MSKEKKKARLTLIRIHRDAVYEVEFDKYLKGDCSAEHLKERARKVKESGRKRKHV
jgi:hypothetical protein